MKQLYYTLIVIGIISVFLIVSCNKGTIDPIEITKETKDTIWITHNTKDTVYFTDTVRIVDFKTIYEGFYVLEDSLMEFTSIAYKGLFLMQKVYNSTKYDNVPYHIMTYVVDSTAKKLKAWGVYSSECKFTQSKWQYLNKAREFVKNVR